MTNPPIGSPPTLEWIAVERLAIDESYQRATDGPASRRLIQKITKGWNWNFCQPLVVSRRDDGTLYVIDGQHRLSAAMERGDIPHLPCVVIGGVECEAAAFVALNTQRQKLSAGDVFNAMLAAGDPDAKRVAELLQETGWRMARTSNPTFWKPGEMFCAPLIVKAVKADETLGASEPLDWELERADAKRNNPALSLTDALAQAIVASCREAERNAVLAA